jgi:hypothetical protein
MMDRTIPRETKMGRPKKAKRRTTPRAQKEKGPKRGRELVSLAVGSYFTHGPSNVKNMQIVRFNSNGRLRTNITYQCNLPFNSIC